MPTINAFKADCGFRNKIKVCNFKPEDCNPEKCDMYNIEFSVKAIKKQAKIEQKAVKELEKKRVKMKKTGEHKTKIEEYKKIKSTRNDKVYGLIKLSKAMVYLKRTGRGK